MKLVLKSYADTRNADQPWLQTIPAHWETRRAKQVFSCIDIRSKTGDEELLTVSSADGVRRRSSKTVTMFMAESYIGHKLCWEGDLVVNSLWAWATGLGFSRYHGIVSTAYSVYRPKLPYREYWEFLHYLFRSRAYDWEFTVRSKGIWISRLQMTDESFMQMPVLLPPPDEQAQIVRFIRHLDHRVNRLIKAKRRLIELLNEQKQAIIQQAVTRGLDPHVLRKPSGVEWLEDIPVDWDTCELRRLAKFVSGGTPSKSEASLWEGDIPWVSPKDMKKQVIEDSIDHISEEGRSTSGLILLPTGTLLIVVRGMILARTVPVAIISRPVTINQDMKGLLINRERILPEFLYMVIKAAEPAIFAMVEMSGHGTRRLATENLARLNLPIPPVRTQAQIVSIIQSETSDVDAAIGKIQSEIDLVREYRTRLIADVVTGQLDVRHLDLPVMEAVLSETLESDEDESEEGSDAGEDGEMEL